MKPRQRHKARRLVLQALYQWHIAKTPLIDLEREFVETNDPHKIDLGYFQHLLHGITKHKDEVDQGIAKYSSRPMASLDPIELSVLRLASYELRYQLDVPYRVVINEALELNKTFGTEDGYKFVNSILDKIAADTRETEVTKK